MFRALSLRTAVTPALTNLFSSVPAVYGAATSLTRAGVEERVLQVVKNTPKIDEGKVTAESHFVNDLGLDSLDTVEVVMAIEDEFAVQIPDQDAEKIHSVAQAIDYILAHKQAK
ncbi:acyl carrier protein [Thecamonas trahens ATCC 50062]|uniref:Acyl carrier protein n=1 Tax=Thecamonas trahens ATCC 50062 TaxID=461836 RepID=A0A0L0DPW9_THETB|nr:acyl carrier protein [Thecamonas trahens ATCC 50062]KNC54354.1 acyl carrier protein [Thecamonas trahens ATCC 50062]|eukprot:XP_013753808.1 acyl carrier protein [Thecamonas trahens ATCC 50062]